MSTHPDEQTLANIRAARTCRGIPPDQVMVPYLSIPDLLDRRAAEMAHKPFLIHYDDAGQRTVYTYGEFNRLVNRTANFLSRVLGVRRGDRVATIGHNHADLVVIYFACWKIGAAVAPQNVTEDDDRIGYILRNSEAVVLFAMDRYLDRVEGIVHGERPIETIREIVEVCAEPCGRYRSFHQEVMAQPEAFTPPETAGLEDEALLVYTSGTTGAPKGVVLTQYNLLVDAHGIARWHDIDADTRMMCVLPIHHVNGTVVTLITPLAAGSGVVLNRAYSSAHFWGRIAREGVQIVSVVPTLLQFSLEYAEKARSEGRSIWGEGVSRDDLSAFRHLICGAGTLAVGLAAAFEELFEFPIVHGYGLSETTCYSCFLPPDLGLAEHRRWMSEYGYPSIGVPIETNEMAIFDPSGSGEQLGPGQRGEICIRGHNVMKYYYLRPEANAEAFRFGWFRSGDEGFYELDQAGRPFFFITGRIKELINRGGVKFSPFDIEEVILQMPQISTALAVGFENDYYGEEVGAYVVLHEGQTLSEEQVIAFCRARMPFEKSPKVVVFGTEVPVTSTGKYQRLRLRDLFRQHQHTQFRP
ncbi:MAG: acyl--CoA ligase [Anaerolineae bacterium]